MSKSIKRKITVELPKPRDLSKNRLSVFQRLGTKKSKSVRTPIVAFVAPSNSIVSNALHSFHPVGQQIDCGKFEANTVGRGKHIDQTD